MTRTRHILLLSGGKDSTALAIFLQHTYPDIDIEYVFCDTHKELPEAYEYLSRLESYLGRPITRLSNDLGDRGFDHWLKVYRQFLPAPNMRWCTKKLKIEPFEEYVGADDIVLYVGIRADEDRQGFLSTKPNLTPRYPFKEHGIGLGDVRQILDESGVGLPEYYSWRSRSGCFFCFFQQKIEWVGLLEHHPERFAEAMRYEKPEEGFTWIQGESLAELARPERVAQIRRERAQRCEMEARRRRPRNLVEAFGASG